MLKSLRSMNVRIGIVLVIVSVSAIILQQVFIVGISYRVAVGNFQRQSLEYAIDFVSYPEMTSVIDAMPEEIGTIFAALVTQIASNNRAAERLFTYRWLIIAGVILILSPILFYVTVVVSRYVTLPIRSLITVTKQLEQGDFSIRAKPNRRYWDSYSLALADDFNIMASSLERLEAERQTMIADIAHELRTPITAIQLRLEAVNDGIDPLNLDLIDSLHKETQLLSGLIVDLRTLSLAEAKQLSLDKRSFNIYELAQQISERFKPLANKKDQNIFIEGANDQELYADAERITQILNNLMSNAVRHAPIEGNITLGFDASETGVTLRVINSGSALPQETINQLFNRFYRADKTRIREEGGSGLGLAIVKALVELHGGTVSATNLSDDQIMFSLFLPQMLDEV